MLIIYHNNPLYPCTMTHAKLYPHNRRTPIKIINIYDLFGNKFDLHLLK